MKATATRLAAAVVAAAIVLAGIWTFQAAHAVRPAATAPATRVALTPFQAFAKKQPVPCAQVKVVKKLPKIDGVLDPVYKKQATPLTLKFNSGGDAKPTATTTVYVLSTKDKLALFFQCMSPDMDAMVANERERDASVWNDDSVELFIDPTNKRVEDGYMHIIANSLGTTYDAKGGPGAADTDWNPKLTVKTKVGKKGWAVEMAIPLKELVKDPKKLNRLWAVNFTRTAYMIEGPEDLGWSPTLSESSHVPAKFGCLWLDVGKVNNAKPMKK